MHKRQKKIIHAIWVGISILAILGMVAFTVLPLIYTL